MKNHPQNRRKHLPDKGLEARKYKNHNYTHTHTHTNNWGEGQTTQLNCLRGQEGATFAQNRQSTLRTLTDICAKKIYQWPIAEDKMLNISRKCKSKQQIGLTGWSNG